MLDRDEIQIPMMGIAFFCVIVGILSMAVSIWLLAFQGMLGALFLFSVAALMWRMSGNQFFPRRES
jgi:membrane protein implicated in regulation of membrane protease activity